MTDSPGDKAPDPHPPLTREGLYALVWTAPLSTLAAQWGISRNGLAKVCDRLLIPYPGRGYWNARKAERPPGPAPGAALRGEALHAGRAGRPGVPARCRPQVLNRARPGRCTSATIGVEN